MYILLQIIYVIVALGLIILVLFQADKGPGLSGAFGGGGQNTVFGDKGPLGMLGKLTTVCVVLFMVLALTLTILGKHRHRDKIHNISNPVKTSTNK